MPISVNKDFHFWRTPETKKLNLSLFDPLPPLPPFSHLSRAHVETLLSLTCLSIELVHRGLHKPIFPTEKVPSILFFVSFWFFS